MPVDDNVFTIMVPFHCQQAFAAPRTIFDRICGEFMQHQPQRGNLPGWQHDVRPIKISAHLG